MDRFTAALISKYTLKIPVKDDWFAPLVGDWDIRCVDAMRRETKGEWFFRRVLDGTGIEDLLLCPAMDPECAVTLRLYRADEGGAMTPPVPTKRGCTVSASQKKMAGSSAKIRITPGKCTFFQKFGRTTSSGSASPFWKTRRGGRIVRSLLPGNGIEERHPVSPDALPLILL